MIDPLADLRTFRAPWWSRLLGSARSRLAARARRRKWRLVGAPRAWGTYTRRYASGNVETIEPIVYLCYERGDGKRRVRAQVGNPGFANLRFISFVYVDVVLPWQEGALTNADIVRAAELSQRQRTS